MYLILATVAAEQFLVFDISWIVVPFVPAKQQDPLDNLGILGETVL